LPTTTTTLPELTTTTLKFDYCTYDLTHCEDGTQNCDETLVDCGGSCESCSEPVKSPGIIGRVITFAGQHWLSTAIVFLLPIIAYLSYAVGVLLAGRKGKDEETSKKKKK
jgi:hypothetical protein